MSIDGTRTPTEFHRELGKIVWEDCGMARNAGRAQEGAGTDSRPCARSSGKICKVPGEADDFNQNLEMAGRVADFMELGELMCIDALDREESCGAHFREEYQTEEGEALRRDDHFTYVAAWEYDRRYLEPHAAQRTA